MKKRTLPKLEDAETVPKVPVFLVANHQFVGDFKILGNNDLEPLREFIIATGTKVAFIQFEFPDYDDYLITLTESTMPLLDSDELDEFEDLVDERNAEVLKLLDEHKDHPIICMVYVMYEGQVFGMAIPNNDLLNELGPTKDEFISYYVSEYESPYDDDEDEDSEEDRSRCT